MKYIKTYEMNQSVYLLADAIINIINSSYKRSNIKCYKVKGGNDLLHVIRGETVVVSLEFSNTSSKIVLYKRSHSKITKKMYDFLFYYFSKNSYSFSTYTGYVEFKISDSRINVLIGQLTLINYDIFDMKDDINKYNL